MTTIPFLLLAVVICNLAVVVIATRNAARRERAKEAAPNVIQLRYYQKRGQIVDIST
jgi:hypothetical protein